MDKLIKECERYGIPIEKPNGVPYTITTLGKKLRIAKKKQEESEDQSGGAKSLDVVADEYATKNAVKPVKKRQDTQYPLLQEAVVRAYLDKHDIKEPTGETTIPISILMAVYGNHAQLGKSGLSDLLPDVVDDQELKKYWDAHGVVQLTPMTPVPIKFVQI